jgi:hypothetical protein
MSNDRPDLPIHLQLNIELLQANIHKKYLERLQNFLVIKASFPSAPPPPRPVALRHVLGEYASKLFEVEADQYPDDPRLEGWLGALANRVADMVMAMVRQLENRSLLAATLNYHVTNEEMVRAVLEVLWQRVNHRLYGLTPTPTRQTAKRPRLSAKIDCPSAVTKLERFLATNGVGLTDFATRAQTTDRTLRRFRRTGKVRRDIFENIARAMGITKEDLMKE